MSELTSSEIAQYKADDEVIAEGAVHVAATDTQTSGADERTPHQIHLDNACIKIMEALEKYSLDDRLFVLSHLAAYHIAPGQKVHEFKYEKMFDVHLKHHRKKLHQLRMLQTAAKACERKNDAV